METSLSHFDKKKIFETGQNTVKWNPKPTSGFLQGVDLDKILSHNDVHQILNTIPTQPLYISMRQKGILESYEVLRFLSSDQITALLDYDVWIDDKLDSSRVGDWLQAIGRLGPSHLYSKFINLEEEYQLAICVGKIQLFNEEQIENLPESVENEIIPMPCNKVFYRFINCEEDQKDTLKKVIDAIIVNNMEYAYSLINYAACLPPNESEQQLYQFRNARLEEDGFIPYEESLSIFNTVDINQLKDKWSYLQKNTPPSESPNIYLVDFVDQVVKKALDNNLDMENLFTLHQGIMLVANNLSAASKIRTYDLNGLNKILQQVKGVIGIALDYLSNSNIEIATKILVNENKKTLFSYGITLFEKIQKNAAKELWKFPLVPEKDKINLKKFQKIGKYGAYLDLIEDVFSPLIPSESVAQLVGFFNKFPMVKTSQDKINLTFEPISSLNHLYLACKDMDELYTYFYFLEFLNIDPNELKSDLHIQTALVRHLMGSDISKDPLTKKEIAFFNLMEFDSIKDKLDECFITVFYSEKNRSRESIGNPIFFLELDVDATSKKLRYYFDQVLEAKKTSDHNLSNFFII